MLRELHFKVNLGYSQDCLGQKEDIFNHDKYFIGNDLERQLQTSFYWNYSERGLLYRWLY